MTDRLLKKLYDTPPSILKRSGIADLVQVYFDLERTLRHLKRNRPHDYTANQIDLKKLIAQLSKSKKRIERKIGNTLLLEKKQLKKKIRTIASNLVN